MKHSARSNLHSRKATKRKSPSRAFVEGDRVETLRRIIRLSDKPYDFEIGGQLELEVGRDGKVRQVWKECSLKFHRRVWMTCALEGDQGTVIETFYPHNDPRRYPPHVKVRMDSGEILTFRTTTLGHL